MPSLLDIGKSAVNAQRNALNVTGQNIANVNTEGYRRRDASMLEVSGAQSDLASKSAQIGLGVNLGEVRRAFNAYLASSTNTAESKFESASQFVQSMARLENLILPTEGDLSEQITAFFSSLSDVSANPGDLAPRTAAIEKASGLTNAFNVTSQMITDLRAQLRQTIDDEVQELNRLFESAAAVNGRLRASNIGAAPPNALLDERDRLATEISKRLMVSVEYGRRHELEIRLGRFANGPTLLEGENINKLSVTHNDRSGSIFNLGSGTRFKTVDDGSLKGLSDSLAILETTVERLDALAGRVVSELNALHVSGIDFDGERGKELFTAKAFEIVQPESNSSMLDIDLLQVPGKVDRLGEMVVSYSAATDFWTAFDTQNRQIGRGRKEIDLGGMVLKVNSKAQDGDKFSVSRVTGEAGRIAFLLQDGRELAAAANFVITPASTNTGSAVMTSMPKDTAPPALQDFLDITTNSISPVSYTEFLSSGVIGFIPSNVHAVDLASFGQSPTVSFDFERSDGLSGFSVTVNGTVHLFDSTSASDIWFPMEENGTEYPLSSKVLAEYLNDGVITSTAGASLKDLGLFAAGFEGGLKIAGTAEFSAASSTSDGVTSPASIQAATEASSFKVFTREGRQIAGQPVSSAEASLLLTEDNGFLANAVYRADYLNSVGGEGYRGAQIDNLKPGGYFNIANAESVLGGIAQNSLIRQNPALNTIEEQTLRFATSDNLVDASLFVAAGSSVEEIAENFNQNLGSFGLVAEAKTIAALELADTSANLGKITFSMELDDGQSVYITADYNDRNLNPLISQINKHSLKTGIEAQISGDGTRVILINQTGNDILLDNFSGEDLTIDALDQDFKSVSSGAPVALTKATKVLGTLEIMSPRAFTMSSSSGNTSKIAQNEAHLSGGLQRSFTKGGTEALYNWDISAEQLQPQASPDGLRVSASDTTFSMTAAFNGTGTDDDLSVSISSASLSNYGSYDISKKMVEAARERGTIPSLIGDTITSLPVDGTSLSLLVGGSNYVVKVENGALEVSGPEEQRVFASLIQVSGGYQVSLTAPGAIMNGQSIRVLDETDAAKFGLAASDSSKTQLSGRTFSIKMPVPAISEFTISGNAGTASSPAANDKAKLTLTDLNGGVVAIETSNTLASNAPASVIASTLAAEFSGRTDYTAQANGGDLVITRSDGKSFLTEFAIIPGSPPAQTAATAAVAPVYSYHKSMDVMLGNATVRVDVRNDDGVYTLTSHNTALKFRSPVKGVSDNSVISIDSADHDPFVSMIAARASGDISIVASTDAKSVGLEAGSFDLELTDNGLKVISSNAEAADVNLDVQGLPGQVLSMTDLPEEDLIIVLDSAGARRLGAEYQMSDISEKSDKPREYRVEMTDKTTGQIELFDMESGHSIATRFSAGVTAFTVEDLEVLVSGFADQGDYFDIGLNQSISGDARNLEAMINLSVRNSERSSFQDDFRSIALGVGSQLESGRMVERSANAMRDAALASEDELSGVNLDEEASRLLEQQQAYKAAAQILQAAREMFDTLVNIM